MRIRVNKSSLRSSMATVEEIEPTIEAVVAYVAARLTTTDPQPVIDAATVKLVYGGHHDRSGWDTHLVLVDGYGLFAFTDGPVVGPAAEEGETAEASE